MAKAKKRSKRLYLEWLQSQVDKKHELTQNDAYRILEGQFLLLEAEEIDVSLVDECLDFLLPEREKRVYPMEKTWKRIVEATGLEKGAVSSHYRHGRLRPAFAIALLLLAIMLVGTTIASALGFNVWEYLVKWRGDILYVETEMLPATTDTSVQAVPVETYSCFANERDCFYEELKKNEFTVKLPTWKPEGFVAVLAQTLDSLPSSVTVSAAYEHPDGRQFFVDVDWLNAPTSMEIERNADETPSVFTREGKTFYWVNNLERKTLIWMDSPYAVTIHGSLTDDELKKMIDSLFEEVP